MYSLELIISAPENATSAFRAWKRFDSSVDMGMALNRIREGTPFDIALDRTDREDILTRLVRLLGELEQLDVTYQLSANNVPRSSHLWDPQPWLLTNVRSALDELKSQAIDAAQEQRRREEWANSSEGQEYLATVARINNVRDKLRSRWEAIGFDDLRTSEKNYLYIWWMYVDVMNGSFHQYFHNSAGDTARHALRALESVGAHDARDALSAALKQFDLIGGFEPNREQRCELMRAVPDDTFGDATKRFYDLSEDIRQLALLEVERDYQNCGIEST